MLTKIISTPWHFMRWLRLGFGIYFLLVSIHQREIMIGLFGGLFLVQAIFDLGCGGSQGCSLPSKERPTNPQEISYEETKKGHMNT